MDVIDLAQAGERTVDRNAIRQSGARLAERQQPLALLGRGCRDPGADGVGRVQPRVRAGGVVRDMVGDKSAEFLKGRHSAPVSAAPKCDADLDLILGWKMTLNTACGIK